MVTRRTRQQGFSALEAIIIVLVLLLLGAGGYVVFSKQGKKSGGSSPSASSSNATWQFDGSAWKASGAPPACPDPLLASPVDTSLATAILYPGQYRGNNYKSHGGFRFDGKQNDDIMVTAPMDAKLWRASRYIEQGEVQHLFMFINPCGILYRFDHLLTLDPKFQAVADKLPPAQVDDSRTTDISDVEVKAGEVIATAAGFKNSGNTSVDFGVNDLRQPNDISANSAWAAKHPQQEFDAYGVCWLDLLPSADKARVRSLPAGDQQSGITSDYCQTAAGTTID